MFEPDNLHGYGQYYKDEKDVYSISNHFDEMEMELRREYREKVQAWIKEDKDLKPVFQEKLEELKDEMLEWFNEQRDLYTRIRSEPNEEKKGWLNWLKDNVLEREKKSEHNISRFNWLLGKVSGKPMSAGLNIHAAKQFSIIDLMENYGARGQHAGGGRRKYLCPVHNEKTPSMVVNTKLNRWKCFGCHEGGDVIDLAMKVEKISFAEAVKKLT